GYEIYAELLRPGSPERDLNYGYGIYPDHVTKALTFALGAAPTHLGPGMSADEIWAAATASIDAGRPVIAAGASHVFVYTGYRVRRLRSELRLRLQSGTRQRRTRHRR